MVHDPRVNHQKNKKVWSDKLHEALWAYRTTLRTPTQAMPRSLVFGGEALRTKEVQNPSEDCNR